MFIVCAIFLGIASPGWAFFGAGKASVGPDFWNQSDEDNRRTVDHSRWDRLLQTYVVATADSAVRQFRYTEVTPEDTTKLDGYIADMQKLDPRGYSRQEQLAYWLNLYNAVSVRAVLTHLAGRGVSAVLPEDFRTRARVKVAGQSLSLAAIEDTILRPVWQDHRIHFGLNCATMDCPNMDSRAYTAATVREQLKTSGIQFINADRGVRYADGKLTVSRLFNIYRNDFAEDQQMLMKVFAHYARDMKALYLLGYTGEIFYSQDLRLNNP